MVIIVPPRDRVEQRLDTHEQFNDYITGIRLFGLLGGVTIFVFLIILNKTTTSTATPVIIVDLNALSGNSHASLTEISAIDKDRQKSFLTHLQFRSGTRNVNVIIVAIIVQTYG